MGATAFPRMPATILVGALLADVKHPALRITGERDRSPEGRALPVRPRSATPAGRNAPCPCGSGRKFKKCHG